VRSAARRSSRGVYDSERRSSLRWIPFQEFCALVKNLEIDREATRAIPASNVNSQSLVVFPLKREDYFSAYSRSIDTWSIDCLVENRTDYSRYARYVLHVRRALAPLQKFSAFSRGSDGSADQTEEIRQRKSVHRRVFSGDIVSRTLRSRLSVCDPLPAWKNQFRVGSFSTGH